MAEIIGVVTPAQTITAEVLPVPTEVSGVGSGSNVTVEPITITHNGTYIPTFGTAYSPITVRFQPPNSLYYRGEEYTSDTGGWVQFGSNGTVTKNVEYIRFTSTNVNCMIITQNKFVFDDVNTINVNMSISNLTWTTVFVKLYAARDTATTPVYSYELSLTTTPTSVSVDVGSVVGEYYLCISLASRNTNERTGDLFGVSVTMSD